MSRLDIPNLQVYTRRSDNTNPQQGQEPDPVDDPPEGDEPGNTDLDVPIAIRKGTRTRHPPDRLSYYANLSPSFQSFTASVSRTVIPRDIKEALETPQWRKAVLEEMTALQKNKT